jgi:hypothetical protein
VSRIQCLCALLLCASACVLPSFEKVGSTDGGKSAPPLAGKACGLSDQLTRNCDSCIRKNCCDLATACGKGTACGKDLLKPITPNSDPSQDFEPLLDCMQQSCDEACGVSWGCLDNYSWPVPKSAYDIPVRVIDFAAAPEMPLPGVTVDACQSIDPGCESGKARSAISDENGEVTLNVATIFDGYFEFSGGGYASTTLQWSEPVYRVGGFTQPLLNDSAIQALAIITGVHTSGDQPFDPNVGHMIFHVQSCLPSKYLEHEGPPHAEAADVAVSFDPSDGASMIFYTDKSGNVSLPQRATSTNGYGGAFNLPARAVTVTARDATSDRVLATGTIVIRPGTLGFMNLLPTSKR